MKTLQMLRVLGASLLMHRIAALVDKLAERAMLEEQDEWHAQLSEASRAVHRADMALMTLSMEGASTHGMFRLRYRVLSDNARLAGDTNAT
jgi:hypothetical protein